MKTITLLVLSMSALLLTGCDEKARALAAQAKAILEQRSVQLSKRIAAEVSAYDAYSSLATEDHRNLVSGALTNERSERANALAVDYLENRKVFSLWRNELSAYAQIDYERNRELLTTDLDASTLYLHRYADLKIELDKVDALTKLLNALAQKPTLKQEVDALAGFAQDTKQEFDKKVCADLKSKKAAGDAAATKLYKDKKCEE